MNCDSKIPVLWISRHSMTEEQLADLERGLGGPVELTVWRDTVEDLEELRPALEKVRAVAAVLPLELMARLMELAGDRPVLQAVSWRRATGRELPRPDGKPEPEFAFVHREWRQLLEVRVRSKKL